MKELTNWTELFYDAFTGLVFKAAGVIPSIIGAIIIIFIGWLVAKVFALVIARILKTLGFDTLIERLNVGQYLEKANVTSAPSKLVGRVVYWILILLVITTAADTLGWERVSDEISKLLNIIPNLLVAVFFFIVGTYIATFIRDLIRGTTSSIGISSGKIISNFVFYFLFAIVSITALEQAGLDTSIITSNMLVIIGTIFIAAAISYGLASKDVLSNILASYFSRRTFREGQTIEIDGEVGKIIDINNVSVTIMALGSEKVRTVIPAHDFLTKKVKIIG